MEEVPEAGNQRLRAAHVRLQEAIEDVCRATGMADGLLTTSWVLYGHQAGFADDTNIHGYFMLTMSGGEQPEHVTLGLLDKALIEVRRQVLED